MKNDTISTILANIDNYNVVDLWYDWFCKETSLRRKGEALLKKLKVIASSNKFDNDKCCVVFENKCPLSGNLYDRIYICEITENGEVGDTLYSITPKSGHTAHNGKGHLFGKENDFTEPLVEGTWRDIKAWFLN